MKTKSELTEIFKTFQESIKESDSFDAGKQSLLELRKDIAAIYDHIFAVCAGEDFCKMPLPKHKTIAYYLYHLTRIEDITSNMLIAGKTQVFFTCGFDKLLNSRVITTGNEIPRDELTEFSKALNIGELQKYAAAVLANTNEIIQNMSYEASKTKVSAERRAALIEAECVSTDENAFWLVDYWCKKTYAGLMLMPFSRHQMMHLDNCLHIIEKIKK